MQADRTDHSSGRFRDSEDKIAQRDLAERGLNNHIVQVAADPSLDDSGKLEQLSNLWRRVGRYFSGVNIVTTLERLSSLNFSEQLSEMESRDQLMLELANGLRVFADELEGREICNTLKALSRVKLLGVSGVEPILAKETTSKLDSFTPGDIIGTLERLSRLGIGEPSLYRVGLDSAAKGLGAVDFGELVSAYMLMVRTGYIDMDLFNGVAERVSPNLDLLIGGNLERLAWTFSKLNLPHHQLEPALLESLHRHANSLEPPKLGLVMSGLGFRNLLVPDIVESVLERAEQHHSRISPDAMAWITWGSAISGTRDQLERAWELCMAHAAPEEFKDASLVRLNVVGVGNDLTMPSAFEPRLEHALIDRALRVPRINDFERDVGAALSYLGLPAVGQVFIDGIFVDFVVELPDRFIVLECDGENYHFVDRDHRNQRLGRDILRGRLSDAHNLEVVRLLDRTWLETEDKHGLLKALLGTPG